MSLFNDQLGDFLEPPPFFKGLNLLTGVITNKTSDILLRNIDRMLMCRRLRTPANSLN